MKAVREYTTDDLYLRCKVTFLPVSEDEQFEDSIWNVFEFPLELTWLATYPKDIYDNQTRLGVHSHPNLNQDLVLAETIRFCQTLKQMYDL